jgi:hypothetical protein
MPGLPLPSQGDQFQFVVCSWLLVGGIALVIFLPALWLDHSRLADVRAGKVSVVEGRADLKSQDFKGQIYRTKAYYLIVGGTKFQLANERQFQAFRQGETYRIFYVRNPPAHTLLSAERLSVFGS